MNLKIAIVTDSTAVLRPETKASPNLRVVTVPLIIDGKEQNEVPPKEYYALLQKCKTFPSTSQPSLGEMMRIYEQLAQEGYEAIISIHITAGISGFVTTLLANQEDLSPIPLTIVDSLSTSLPMGVMVDRAVALANAEVSVEAIINELNIMKEVQHIYLVVDDLHHLVRTGRLSNGTALLGSLLKIKPILEFDEDGKIVLFKKVRTAKKAYKEAMQLIQDELTYYQQKGWQAELGIAHTNVTDLAQQLAKELEKASGLAVRVVDLGNVIGTHTGEKTVGFGIMYAGPLTAEKKDETEA